MIVLRSTYDRLDRKYLSLAGEYQRLESAYVQLHAQWTSLVNQINAKGGQQFLNGPAVRPPQLSAEDIKRLLMLVHPDKHGGKESAVQMTQKLLQLRATP